MRMWTMKGPSPPEDAWGQAQVCSAKKGWRDLPVEQNRLHALRNYLHSHLGKKKKKKHFFFGSRFTLYSGLCLSHHWHWICFTKALCSKRLKLQAFIGFESRFWNSNFWAPFRWEWNRQHSPLRVRDSHLSTRLAMYQGFDSSDTGLEAERPDSISHHITPLDGLLPFSETCLSLSRWL